MRRNEHEYYVRPLGKSYLRRSASTPKRARSRNDRICHFGRRARCYCHFGHYGFSAEDPRALDGNQRWNHGALARLRLNEEGQSTVEFALVTFAFVALCAGIASLWHGLSGDTLSAHGLMAASHHVILTLPGGLADLFLY